MALATARFLTSGMHCSSCSMLVDITLADLEGIMESKTDHATGISVVSYDSDVLTTDAIIDTIRSVGYEAEIEG